MATTLKKSHLRQGYLFPSVTETVYERLSAAIVNCPDVKSSEFVFDQSYHGDVRHRRYTDEDLCLHFCSRIPGAKATVLPDPGTAVEFDTSEQSPPSGTDFAKSEVALVVRRNLVAFVTAGSIRDQRISRMLSSFVRKHTKPSVEDGQENWPFVNLSAKVDEAEMKRLIEVEGVSELVLNTAIDQGLINSLKGKKGKIATVLKGLSTLIESDRADSQVKEYAEMSAALSFKIGSGQTQADTEAIKNFASQAADDNMLSNVGFRTPGGIWYSANRLLISKTYKQQGSKLDYDLAWQAGKELITEHINANFIIETGG